MAFQVENNLILTERILPNGRKAEVVPLTFGRARICLVDEQIPMMYDDVW